MTPEGFVKKYAPNLDIGEKMKMIEDLCLLTMTYVVIAERGARCDAYISAAAMVSQLGAQREDLIKKLESKAQGALKGEL